MFSIDIRTIFLSYILINVVNLILIGSLYVQIKNRFPGTFIILISFILSTTGNVLVFLRDLIPDFISISVANTMVVFSTVLLLIGFERFIGKKGIQIQNYILVLLFFLVHTYFAFVKPDMNIRNINFSLAYVFLSIQIAFLMLKRTPVLMRKITWPVGVLFILVVIIQVFHIYFISKREINETNYFNSGPSESIYVVAWEIIIVLVAYSIILMYNKRLIIDLNNQEEKFSKAFHAAPFITMLSKLDDGEIFEVNKSVESIAGYQPIELIHSKTTELRFWEKNTDRQKFISELKSKRRVLDQEYRFRKKSGELFTGLISANTIEINNEKCIVSVISDISERKISENKLVKSEASLRELNSTKDKFFSIIAHDLKSPFNGILGFSELLLHQINNKDYSGIEKYAQIINKSSHGAVNLLTNLMNWSRLQTGRMEFNAEYIEVVDLIHSVAELENISAKQKSIKIEFNLPNQLIVQADKFMLETIFRNLISNAIKFTPREGIILISAAEKERDFLFFVKDSGVGIEKNNLPKLFRIDEDFSLPGTENEKGTGLGLILCNDFIKKHSGKIWIESELNVGSTFYFSIPKP